MGGVYEQDDVEAALKVISRAAEPGGDFFPLPEETDFQKALADHEGATKAVVEAPQIELVDSAAHPVVFGDDLLQYLNQIVMLYQTHVHPGELALGIFPVTPAPPVPPFPPPSPTMLSMRVKSG